MRLRVLLEKRVSALTVKLTYFPLMRKRSIFVFNGFGTCRCKFTYKKNSKPLKRKWSVYVCLRLADVTSNGWYSRKLHAMGDPRIERPFPQYEILRKGRSMHQWAFPPKTV